MKQPVPFVPGTVYKESESVMMNSKMKALILSASLLAFSGCFETQFDFVTFVKSDGSVERETKIEGRGAGYFMVPEGSRWQVKTWEEKGVEAFVPNTYYHIQARGKFGPGEPIASDYRFNVEKILSQLGKAGKKRLAGAGIQEPFSDHIFSRNEVRVREVNGWLVKTMFYEETFQSAGVLALLAKDLEDEIRKEYEQSGHKIESDEELGTLAVDKLEKDILPRLKFRSKVVMPGKIISSDAQQVDRNSATWIFSMKDFRDNYTVFTLHAMSRQLQPVGLVLIGVPLMMGILIVLMMIIGMGQQKKGRRRTV
jgi:hypothetical protein